MLLYVSEAAKTLLINREVWAEVCDDPQRKNRFKVSSYTEFVKLLGQSEKYPVSFYDNEEGIKEITWKEFYEIWMDKDREKRPTVGWETITEDKIKWVTDNNFTHITEPMAAHLAGYKLYRRD